MNKRRSTPCQHSNTRLSFDRYGFAAIICALFISGCSGSSSGTGVSQAQDGTTGVNANETSSATSGTTVSEGIATTGQSASDDDASSVSTGGTNDTSGTTTSSTNGPVGESTNASTDESAGSGAESTAGVSDPVASVPAIPESSLVNFTITVPVYVSNALQVRLVWGDVDTTAMWVVDEIWATSVELPTNTENLLAVTFSDDNGAITLGSFEQPFATSANTSEFQIAADQFDTDRWDNDGDGVSNLGESIAGTNPLAIDPPQPVVAELRVNPDKTFQISWQASTDAEFYRVLENPDGVSGFNQISEDLAATTLSYDHRVALYQRVNARYIVQACSESVCVDSNSEFVTGSLESAINYFKASNTHRTSFFGSAVALSDNGNTLAIGASFERSVASGINGNQNDASASASGAVYLFERANERWQQQAYIKASNTAGGDLFGTSLSLSANGDTLAVGAYLEDSAATGINGNQGDNAADGAGAVYVFTRSNENWQQQAYVKPGNTDFVFQTLFGFDVSLSADGNTLAVGAFGDSNGAKGINPMLSDISIQNAGAAYVFVRNSGGNWQQQAYIKASNSDWGDNFGRSVSLSADGNLLAVGARNEQSSATGVNGSQADNSIAGGAGAVYVYTRSEDIWQLQTYLKASNPGEGDNFGWSVSLSKDGSTLAVGATAESSAATGIGGDQIDDTAASAGAVYVFVSNNTSWEQQAYIKAGNAEAGDRFGSTLSLSADGNTLAVGSQLEASAATGINSNQFDNSAQRAGAAYVFSRNVSDNISGNEGAWQQQAYLKASNTEGGVGFGNGDGFSSSLALSADGNTLAVGAQDEDGAAIGINGDQNSNAAHRAGAVYLY